MDSRLRGNDGNFRNPDIVDGIISAYAGMTTSKVVDVVPAKSVLPKAGSGNPYGRNRTRMPTRPTASATSGDEDGDPRTGNPQLRRLPDPRLRRPLPRARRGPARARAGGERRVARGDRREDEGDGAVRRDHRGGVRRARAVGLALHPDRRAGLRSVDVGVRHLQLASHHGRRHRTIRHRDPEAALPAAVRERRAQGRDRADRARLRNGPPGHPHPGGEARRALRGERCQDVDQQQRARKHPSGAGEDRTGRRPPRIGA